MRRRRRRAGDEDGSGRRRRAQLPAGPRVHRGRGLPGRRPLLRGEELASARRFLEQEQAHADAILRALRKIGGTPIKPKAKYDFPTLSDRTDFLSFASDLENTTIGAYIDSLPKLTDRSLRGTAAAIVTTEAEHLSVIRTALGGTEAPSAFVTGQPSDDS